MRDFFVCGIWCLTEIDCFGIHRLSVVSLHGAVLDAQQSGGIDPLPRLPPSKKIVMGSPSTYQALVTPVAICSLKHNLISVCAHQYKPTSNIVRSVYGLSTRSIHVPSVFCGIIQVRNVNSNCA